MIKIRLLTFLLNLILKNKKMFFLQENGEFSIINEIGVFSDILICYYDEKKSLSEDKT